MHKKVDGIINNAGIIQPFINISELENGMIEKIIDVNFYGTLNMIRTFLPILKSRPEAYILNVSSMGGFLPVPGQSIYGASKAAVKLMTEALIEELKGTNINVSLVMPGGINTGILNNSNVKLDEKKLHQKFKKYILSPEEAAQKTIKTIEKNKKVVYIGKDSKFFRFFSKLNHSMAAALMSSLL
jgi:short-subunit dehydrogenase